MLPSADRNVWYLIKTIALLVQRNLIQSMVIFGSLQFYILFDINTVIYSR